MSKRGHRFEKCALTAKSDVWSVGNVIWGLMRIHEGHHTMYFKESPAPPREPDLRDLVWLYSNETLRLVQSCYRMGFVELLRHIRRWTGDHPDPRYDLVNGLRTKKDDTHPAWGNQDLQLQVSIDQW